jgi:sulfite reductase beta subunit-like hemoprotein
MADKKFEPNFHTPKDDFCREELNKLQSGGMRGNLYEQLREDDRPDIAWEAEQLAKSYGIYLEFNRRTPGPEKDFIYMLRVTIPGGGPLGRDAWQVLDDVASKYAIQPDGGSSLRLTTRQNIQFHWVRKKDLLATIQLIAQSQFSTMNGCGDNTRNVLACPLSHFSDLFDANHYARRAAEYFRLPVAPYIEIYAIDPNYVRTEFSDGSFQYADNLLNRKFKIAFSTVHHHPETGEVVPDNCVECLTNDLAAAPVFEKGKLQGFQLYIGGGQGEKNGKPTMAALAQPLAFVSDKELFPAMDAIVKVHQEWGDRQNRHWARLKYVIKKMGMPWYREQVQERLEFPLQATLEQHDFGPRQLHHGWWEQPTNGLLSFGMFVENGRVTDSSANGRLKTAVREIMSKYAVDLTVTPNQDILFSNIDPSDKERFLTDLQSYGYGKRDGKEYSTLRRLSGACVGRTTCRLAYTDSEEFEPVLIDELERMGWADMHTSIGITGCERQCFRPSTKAIGLIGSGLNLYQFRLGGTEDARHQGLPVVSADGSGVYLRSIPREQVATVINVLFENYMKQREEGEELGYFHRRVGLHNVIEHLKNDPRTSPLMAKTDPNNNLATMPV